jgi:hypothetical protein
MSGVARTWLGIPCSHLQSPAHAFDGESATFRWKDYAHGNKKAQVRRWVQE